MSVPQLHGTEAYVAATAEELATVGADRRAIGLVNQAALFPYRGTMTLTPEALTLEGYMTLMPGDIEAVEQEFVPEYNRFAAGGVRGGFPSFGFFKGPGAPLVLHLKTGERIILLLGFRPISGATKNREWLDPLKEFARQAPAA